MEVTLPLSRVFFSGKFPSPTEKPAATIIIQCKPRSFTETQHVTSSFAFSTHTHSLKYIITTIRHEIETHRQSRTMRGGTSGHVSLGVAFFLIGIWHLFNSIKLHSLRPKTFVSLPWFPAPKFKYLEPIIIISVTTVFISTELFVGHRPIAADGTIPTKSLRHYEHSIIALSFSIYAFFVILLDKISPPAKLGFLHLLQAMAFAQQLLIIHLHSTDHMGIEGQYHWLLQIVTFLTLFATVSVIACPRSFLSSFVRGFSVIFQGVWLVVMGIMLWTPELLPKGCYLKSEIGRDVVLCRGDRALERAKALVNLQFGFYLIVMTVLAVVFYLVVIKIYPPEKVEYRSLNKIEEEDKNMSRSNSFSI